VSARRYPHGRGASSGADASAGRDGSRAGCRHRLNTARIGATEYMTQPGERVVTDDLALLLEALPPRVVESLASHGGYDDLLEVVLDLGRLPEARFPGRELILSEEEISEADIQ